MRDHLETASWLALAYASEFKLARVKDIVAAWCLQGGQPLAALFEPTSESGAAQVGLSADEAGQLSVVARHIPEQAAWLVRLESSGIRVITRSDARYPRALARWLPLTVQPLLLFCQGDVNMLNRPSAAVIGPRDAGGEMVGLARELATLLAEEGLVVVSGLGKGVGQAAFNAALATEGGDAMAVLPMGISVFHSLSDVPVEATSAVEGGQALLVSPFHPEAKFTETQAVARNKLIVGLVEALFVVAAAEEGVARQMADEALRLGKTVYVWDTGQAIKPAITGNQDLIAAGALPIAGVPDTLDAVEAVVAAALERMELAAPPATTSPPLALQVKESEIAYDSEAVLDLLSKTGRVPEALARRLRAGSVEHR